MPVDLCVIAQTSLISGSTSVALTKNHWSQNFLNPCKRWVTQKKFQIDALCKNTKRYKSQPKQKKHNMINEELQSIQFDTKEGPYFIEDRLIEYWIAAYPELNLKATLSKAAVWLVTHPGRQKTLRLTPKFINSWLSKTNYDLTGKW